MNTENTKNQEEGEGILFGTLGTIFFLAIFSGIVFVSLKWHKAEIRIDTNGNITAVSKNWWGMMKKKETTYNFNQNSKTWTEKDYNGIPKTLHFNTEQHTIKL